MSDYFFRATEEECLELSNILKQMIYGGYRPRQCDRMNMQNMRSSYKYRHAYG